MTTVYTDSVLKTDKRYLVQDVSKFPKAKSFMIGQHCILKQIVGSTAHVMFTGRMTEIPVRSLIDVVGFHAKAVSAKNADGFVVIKQNTLGLPVGTAYLNHDKEKSDTNYVVIETNGKEVKIPFDILGALVRNKKKEKSIRADKIADKTGFTPAMVEVMDELASPHENRQDDDFIPPAIVKLLPGVNLIELRDLLRSESDIFYDYEGNDHKTISDCDKANTRIRHRLLKERLMAMANRTLEESWTR